MCFIFFVPMVCCIQELGKTVLSLASVINLLPSWCVKLFLWSCGREGGTLWCSPMDWKWRKLFLFQTVPSSATMASFCVMWTKLTRVQYNTPCFHTLQLTLLSSSSGKYLNFSLQYHYFKDQTHRSRENDHQWKDFLMYDQILSTMTIRNVWRTVMRICMLILGLKWLIAVEVWFTG